MAIDEYIKAEELLESSLEEFENIPLEKHIFICYSLISKANEAAGNLEEAEKYLTKTLKLQHIDDYTREQLQKRIDEIYG